MRFAYAARFENTGPDEVVVSFRDLPECLTSGADEVEALEEAQDALEAVVAARINRGEPSPRQANRLQASILWPYPPICQRKRPLCLHFAKAA